MVLLSARVWAIEYPIQSKTLANGLKIVVCEKNTNNMAEIQVWYRVGSKDEWDGVRGMAHLFEHMMFRGSKKFNGENKPFKIVDRVGGQINAYTTYDRTVYHEEVPAAHLEQMIEMEADRMANLELDQTILDTEREVVGEEYRLGFNRWQGRLEYERYPSLYPKNHPYAVDVIGKLDEITRFTTAQCQDFYDKFYSPNNAFVIITGNVKAKEVFDWCEKHFGVITKQLPANIKKTEPDIFKHKIAVSEMSVDFPVQIYTYVIPAPAVGHPDYHAFNLLTELLISNQNSFLKKRLINTNYAYDVGGAQQPDRLYSNFLLLDVVMNAQVGNARVKKEIQKEINGIIKEGIEEKEIEAYLRNLDTRRQFSNYSNSELSAQLGFAEYYYNDYKQYDAAREAYQKMKSKDLEKIARKYFDPESLQVINVKPLETE